MQVHFNAANISEVLPTLASDPMADAEAAAAGDKRAAEGTQPEAKKHKPQTQSDREKAAAFQPAAKFTGRRAGFVFKKGEQGVGYYEDVPLHVEIKQRPAATGPADNDEEMDIDLDLDFEETGVPDAVFGDAAKEASPKAEGDAPKKGLGALAKFKKK